MNNILKTIFLSVIVVGCTESTKKGTIANRVDYAKYLSAAQKDLSPLKKELALWTSKIEIEPRGFIFYEKLGSTYNQLFEKTGDISYLHKSDSVFGLAQKISKGKWKVPSLLSISGLAIKQHNFDKAATYAVIANELSAEKFGPLLMQFDAEMELGNYKMAGAILKKTRRMNSFDYLVRLSKYKDYEGDLDSAIFYMEKANDLVKAHQKERKLWATANLGDMYGHAGRIEDSYANYLKVLALDSTYDYALKGIAWVTYSNDGNTAEAKEILSKLQQKTAMPDYYMTLAEISEYEGNEEEAEMYINQFLTEAGKSEYQGMYNKYLIDIFLARGDFASAEKLAREEIERRPNPATYDWLAWTLFNQGKADEAVELYRENVEGKTYEPEATYHMGLVYHAAGINAGKDYLRESLDAKYELGPLAIMKIKSALKG
ncbi:tetratricopeptide repeat protein [Ekhidna sp. To15]|uniref:tetratricopeptide repeat protein n=1 Tax=Ekhidna sp. To15 TaxID=3395267 RepID=UPI003F521359